MLAEIIWFSDVEIARWNAEIQMFKSLVFVPFPFSDVRFSDIHCMFLVLECPVLGSH